MISLLSRHRKALFIAVIAVFLIGTFVGLGGYLFSSRDTSGTVALVGSVKIPYTRFAVRVDQYAETLRSKGTDVSDDMLKQIKQGMLRDMIVDALLSIKADELGIIVTDEELARDIRNTPAFQRGGAFDQDVYFSVIRSQFRDTPQAYEAQRLQQIKTNKFKQLVYQTAKVTPLDLSQAYAQEHKGVMKSFEKDKAEFTSKLQQQRALDLLNYYLRQLSTQIEIRSYLDQREAGA